MSEQVEAVKNTITNHGLQMFDNLDIPDSVIAEALRELADEYARDDW